MEEKTKENEMQEETTGEETIDKDVPESEEKESRKSKKLKEKIKQLEEEVNTWKISIIRHMLIWTTSGN